MGALVEIEVAGGSVRGYRAGPETGSGPAVVVIQEYWGLVPHIRDVCDRFAAEGFVALAPDLYHGEVAEEPDEAGKLMMALNLDRAAAELAGAVEHLIADEQVRGDAVGTVGFCMGGGLALVLAARQPGRVAACASFYGVIPWERCEPDWGRLTAAVQLHVASEDRAFAPDAAEAFEARLRGLGVDVELFVYDGAQHAFFNDTRPAAHDPEAASLAWTRTLSFLRAHLG